VKTDLLPAQEREAVIKSRKTALNADNIQSCFVYTELMKCRYVY